MSDDKPKVVIVTDTGRTGLAFATGHVGQAEIKMPVTLKPDIVGPHGRAWRVNFAEMLKRHGAEMGQDASLGTWVIEAPWAHPVWHSYVMALVHLRPTEKGAAPKISLPGATHEFWLWAMDPDADRASVIRGEEEHLHFLTPMNFGAQLRSPGDEAAIKLMETTIQDIVDGKLSPDTDFFRMWVDRFGDSLVRKR